MSNIIEQLEQEQMRTDIPDFSPGDTVTVQVKVTEGSRERLQAFEGVVIAKRNRGLNSAFTVRKITHSHIQICGFQRHRQAIGCVTPKHKGNMRRAKLYYLRELSGKSARIKEKL